MGVGAGIILDGRPYSGEGYAAGEIGHMAVLPTLSGATSSTTLEYVASARAIAEQLNIGDPGHVEAIPVFREVARRAAGGDEDALRAVELAGRYLGIAMAAVTGILDIRHIIVSGPATRLGETLLNPAREELSRRVLPAVESRVEINAGLVDRPEEHGAALFVLSQEMGIL